MMIRSACFIALAAVTAPAWAQDLLPEPLSLSARVDFPEGETSVPIGAPFTLVIEARHPPGGIALLPETVDVGANLIERADARKHERRREGALEVDRYTLQVLPFTTGDITIAPIQLALGSTVATTAPLAIFVSSGFSEDEEPVATSTQPEAMAALEQMAAQDPPPRMLFVEDASLLRWLFTLLVFAAIAYFAYRWWKQRKARPVVEPPPPPPRPAHEIALASLASLRQAPWLAAGDFKMFYTELSVILRRYVGDRYGFESLELTFDELMEVLETQSTPGLDNAVLRHLLTLSDQVKFAKFTPRQEEGLDALKQADGLVQATKPISAPSLTAQGLS
ncbi:MAG: hypothetical protein AAFV29_07250 [Myxococcota bacterium]